MAHQRNRADCMFFFHLSLLLSHKRNTHISHTHMHIDRYLYKTNFNLSRISISMCIVKMLKLNNSLHNHINKNEHMLICWGDEYGPRVRVRFKRAQSYNHIKCCDVRQYHRAPNVDGANCEWFRVDARYVVEARVRSFFCLLVAHILVCARSRSRSPFALAQPTSLPIIRSLTCLLSHSAFSIWNIVCQYRQIIRFYSTPLGLFLLISLFILSLRSIYLWCVCVYFSSIHHPLSLVHTSCILRCLAIDFFTIQ